MPQPPSPWIDDTEEYTRSTVTTVPEEKEDREQNNEREVAVAKTSDSTNTFSVLLQALAVEHERQLGVLQAEMQRPTINFSNMQTAQPAMGIICESQEMGGGPAVQHIPSSISRPARATSIDLPEGIPSSPTGPIHGYSKRTQSADDSSCPSRRSPRNSFTSRQSGIGSAAISPTTGKEIIKTTTKLKLPEKNSRLSTAHLKLDSHEKPTAAETFLNTKFDIVMGALIILNAIFTFIESEHRGHRAAARLGVSFKSFSGNWNWSQGFFDAVELIMNSIFVAELGFRFALIRCKLFYNRNRGGVQKLSLMDAVIVLLTSIDVYILKQLDKEGNMDFVVLRLARLARLVRYIRFIRVMHLFAKLRVLVHTTMSSFYSLLWSMILLLIVMLVASMLLCRMLNPYIEDNSNALETRQWLFKHYGTSSRSFYTMFEITLAGCWPTYARPIVEHVNVAFAFFFFFYVFAVVFGITRIITALFLKDTLQVAAQDAEMVLQEKTAQRMAYIEKLTALFHECDKDGSGTITFEEFQDLLSAPSVRTWFHVLDIEVHEVLSLFQLLDNGEGVVTYNDYIKGLQRLKGAARSMDVVAIGRDCEILMRTCQAILDSVKELEGELANLRMQSRHPLFVSAATGLTNMTSSAAMSSRMM